MSSDVPPEELEWDTDEKVEALRTSLGADITTGWPGPTYLHGPLGDSRTLRRFLRARKGVLEDATKMVVNHVKWRRAETPSWPERNTPPADIAEALRSGSAYVRGEDKEGRPTIYVRSRFHVAGMDRKVAYAYVIHLLDEVVARADHGGKSEQFTAVLDAGGLSWSSFDPDVLKFVLKMLSGNYPERLGRLYILNEGFMFRMLWKVIEPFIDSRTARKISFLGGEDKYKPVLQAHWEVDQLAAEYGGADTYAYNAEDVLGTPSSHVSVRLGPLPAPDVHAKAHGHHHGPHPGHGHHHSAAP